MIKVDIVNEVSRTAEITKVRAEVAVDAVFDTMRLSIFRLTQFNHCGHHEIAFLMSFGK